MLIKGNQISSGFSISVQPGVICRKHTTLKYQIKEILKVAFTTPGFTQWKEGLNDLQDQQCYSSISWICAGNS